MSFFRWFEVMSYSVMGSEIPSPMASFTGLLLLTICDCYVLMMLDL